MSFQDLAGNDIEVGDIIAFTATAGQSVSSINLGKVTRFTRKTIWVQECYPDFSPKMQSTGYMRGTGRYPYTWAPDREETEYVKTGEQEVGETVINSPRKDRFLILQKG